MIYQLLQKLGQQTLEQAGVPEAALDARLLLEWACEIDRSTLLAHGDREADPAQEAKYLTAIAKRADRIPLQHLTGVQDFMGLTFEVNENVLIPRQDTEILVEEVMKDLHGGSAILDLCTGSGCILISLLKYSNECHGVGVDLSPAALEVASRNAQKLIPDRDCTFICGDLFENVTGKFDILTSNPPYIPTAIVDTLMPEVRDHEPRLALDGTADGLHFYRRILKECKSYLNKGAMIFFEIGYDQGEAVRTLMQQEGCLEVKIVKDYAGLDRVVTGVYSPKDGL
ncbi:MAG: peptide chain release factor N(5)-glutamine methyltransferase [Lachnospiraceae bacterium]|nr:peptide chain release factor N(5)-glutamine methyltransferase [Lachnospiraceae bacterium]